ncbi:MAG: InlB B-repeat-containing protein [Vulcanibacillus sp.]
MKIKLLWLFIVLCMVLTLLPVVTLAAVTPSGYTTDSHGIMAYKYLGSYSYRLDLQGYYNGDWRKVTFMNKGFGLGFEINGTRYSINRMQSGTPFKVYRTGLEVTVDTNFLYNGKTIQLLYTVKNTNSGPVTFNMGSAADIMIGRDDFATIIPFDGGFKMSSNYESDGYAQLNFWGGSGIEGVTSVDTYWYGHYSKAGLNFFNDLSPKTSLSGIDSACAWSWKNRTIAAGETQTYSVMIGVGAPGSETLVTKNAVDYFSTVGTKPSSELVDPGESITLPTLTEPGYAFGGWYSDAGLTSRMGDSGDSYTSYTPTEDITLYAKWTPILSPVKVTLTKDNGAWTGQSLALYQGGYHKYALTESGVSGVYSADAQNGTYDIYKEGKDTGVDAVVATTATSGIGSEVDVTIGYTTLTTTTKLDDLASSEPGDVDYRTEGAVAFSTDFSSPGTYTTIVRNTDTTAYDVYVDALDSHQNISTAAKNATVNYFTGVADIQLDSASYEDRRVVFSRTEGENTYYYTANYQTSGGNAGKYTIMLPAGPSDDYTYTVSVDGRVLGDTVSYDDKNSAAAYYTAHVDVLKDGSDWTSDISVYLEKDGLEQKLTYTDGTDYQLVLFSDGSIYNVFVTGSNSLRDTSFDLSSNTVQEIDYWSVNFYTTDDASVYTGRIIQNGKTVSKPSTPNVTGKSFAGWHTTTTRDVLYDYTTAIVDVTNIYAKFVDPAVSINGTIMDESTYTIPNLTLTGFPFTGTPIKSATLFVDSGSVAIFGSDFAVTGSGSKMVTVKFGDEGTTPDIAQAFLRNNTVCTSASTDPGGGGITYTPQSLTVTIGGDTSDGTVTATTTNIYPVNLNLNEGTINSGNLSYYQEGVGASLPTELSKSGKVFAGWYESADFSSDPVSSITAVDSGEKTYYAKWADSSPEKSIVFGTPVLSEGKFTYPDLTLSPSAEIVYSAKVSIDNGMVSVAEDVGHKVVYDSANTTAIINFGASGLPLAGVQTLLQTKTSFTVTPSNEYPSVTIELDGNVTSLPVGTQIYVGDGTKGLKGHYYIYVSASKDWNAAYNAAKEYRYMGMRGYLATITSAEEGDIFGDILGGITDPSWTGGTLLKQVIEGNYDSNAWVITSASDYFWRWVCGPEAGRKFYYGWTTAETSTVNSAGQMTEYFGGDPLYTSWSPGEPNHNADGFNVNGELKVEFHSSKYWNDRAPNVTLGYFVEFGGYPEDQDPGEISDDLIIRGSSSTLAPTASGDTIYANGAALIISGANAYWDMDSDGVLDANEDDIAIYTPVSGTTTISAGTNGGSITPPSGQITVLDGSTVGTIIKGNVVGPVVVKLAGDVGATIDFETITMVEIIDFLTGDAGDIKLNAIGDLGAGRVLAIDKTGADVIDMTKFTLNNGDNALVAVDNELQISGYGVNTQDSETTTLTGTAPTYITATVEVKENGSLADAESVVLKLVGTEISLNRSATGVYSYIGLLDAGTSYTLYVNGVVVGDSYNAFASPNTNQAPSYYTAQVTYKVDSNNTDAQSVVLKAEGKGNITLTQQTNSETGALITGVYEYRSLADSSTEYAIWVNGENSGQTLTFADEDYQKTVNHYTTQVSLNNSGVWSGQNVTLRNDSGNIIYILNETETSGTYSALTKGDSVGTYNIYVNGEDSGMDITPSKSAKVTSGTISYMTITITTNKNGSAVRLGDVTIEGKPAIESSTGNYTITLPADSYAVNVAGTNVGDVTGVSPSLTANFYTVNYDGDGASGTVPSDNTIYFDRSTVTILSAGELSKTEEVFAGWQMDGTTYNTGQTFILSGVSTLTALWSDTAAAEVSWTVDGTTYYGRLSEAIAATENNGLPVSITIQNDTTITEDMTIPDNAVVTVPEGKTVTVAENVTLTNEGTISSNGTITGDGALDNNGTVDNTAVAVTGGTIAITTDNYGGEIEGGTISSGVTVSGGEITGPIVNNGTLTNTDVSGNVDNNSGAVISGGTITGDLVNHNGASIIGGTTVNGNVDNEGSVQNIIVNGSMQNTNGTATGTTVAGTTTAPGGTVTSKEQLVAALGGAAHIDPVTGAVVLDGDVQLDQTITIAGDIAIDLNGHTITGPNGNDNDSGPAENGSAAIIVSSGIVDIKDNSNGGGGSIYGGAGGAGSTVSGNGGAGISVTGGTLTVGEDVEVIGGTGGRDETGSSGSGGSGIAVSESGNVTIKGSVTGGEGGEGGEVAAGGSGGSGVKTSGTVIVAIEGEVTGGSGGAGDVGGSGGAGIVNESTGTVEINGTSSGGNGGIGNTEGTGGASVTNEGTGTLSYKVTVNYGTTAKSSYIEGESVTITANAPASGKQFKEWTVESGGITLASSTNASMDFIMPASTVEVTANYEDIPNNSSASSTTATSGTEAVNVIVNGKTEKAGTETISTENGKSTVMVAVNNKAIESKIEEAVKLNTTGQQNVIQVTVADTKSDVAKVELTGDIVKQLEKNTFDVLIKRDAVEYVIPAKELTISNVAKELGVAETSLKDIKVEVQITKLKDSVVAKYNEVAKENRATIVFPPTAFEVIAKTTKTDGTTGQVEITKFSNYVERIMRIPDGVDPSKITTGIVFNPDGTYSHVPTEVFQKNEKWYAKLNSLTNSNYSVIWNPITVESVDNHWSKDAVNDMASRLVIFDPENFEPNKAITRADFAEYIVRALGLFRKGETHENKFSDVKADGDRTLAVLISSEYGIVTGYPDGTFKPNALITREEAMTMYQRAMKTTKLTGSDANRILTYSDSTQVSKWAVPYVTDVLSAHVFNGTTATTISPRANLTYAEAAQAIKNLLVESKLINK